MHFLRNFSIIVATVFLLLHCSHENIIYVDTYSMKILNGNIKAYEISDGVVGQILDSSSITSSPIALKVGRADSILIELTNATFIDIATKEQLSFSSKDRWLNIISQPGNFSSKNTPLQINPLTSLSAKLAMYKMGLSLDKDIAIKRCKILFYDHFRTQIDSLEIASGDESYNLENFESLKYFLVMGGLSQLALTITEQNKEQLNEQKVTVIDITRHLMDDISFDGVFDGLGKNGPISIANYNFSQSSLREDLANSIREFMAANNIHETEEIFSFLLNIINNESELFISLFGPDLISPSISLIEPENLSFANNTIRLILKAYDPSGISELTAYINNDGYIYLSDLNPSPNIFEANVNTRDFPDGILSVLARALDINGNVKEATFKFRIDNTAPTFTSNLKTENITFTRDTLDIRLSNVLDGEGSGNVGIQIEIDHIPINEIQKIDNSTYSAHVDIADYGDGLKNISIKATDSIGNYTVENNPVLFNHFILSKDNFSPYNHTSTLTETYSTIYAGYLDMDEYPDIVTSFPTTSDCVKIHLGNPMSDYNSTVISISPEWCSFSRVYLAGNCDINGDGHKELIVGMPDLNVEGGKIVAYFGPLYHQGIWGNGTYSMSNYVPGTLLGTDVMCFDVDGDSYDDIITKRMFNTQIFWGPNLSINTSINRGGKIFNIGDISNDGIEDFIIGNHIYYGSSNRSFGQGINFANVSSASPFFDVNGDGYKDFLIGFKEHDNGYFGTGIAYIVLGGQGFHSIYKTLRPLILTNDFGQSVAYGDVDGDGHADIMVGAPGHNDGRGAVFLFLGPQFLEYQLIESNQGESSFNFGKNLLSGFDLNSDSRADLLTQELKNSSSGSELGSFHLFFDEF